MTEDQAKDFLSITEPPQTALEISVEADREGWIQDATTAASSLLKRAGFATMAEQLQHDMSMSVTSQEIAKTLSRYVRIKWKGLERIAAPWVQCGVYLGGPGRNGRFPGARLKGAPHWKANTGGGVYRAPIVADKTAIINNDRLVAFDAWTGKEKWRFPASDELFIPYEPCAYRGRVYCGDNKGSAFALDIDTGKILWEKRLGIGSINLSIVASQGVVLFHDDEALLFGLDAETGETKWARDLIPEGEGVDPVDITVAKGCVYVPTGTNSHLVVLDLLTGDLIQQLPELNGNELPVAIHDDLLVASFNKQSDNHSRNIAAFQLESDGKVGKELWSAETKHDPSSSPAISDELVIVATNVHGLRAFDRFTGEEVWRNKFKNELIQNSPIVSGDTVYVTTDAAKEDKNRVAVLDLDTGKERRTFFLKNRVNDGLTIYFNTLYVVDMEGEVNAFR